MNHPILLFKKRNNVDFNLLCPEKIYNVVIEVSEIPYKGYFLGQIKCFYKKEQEQKESIFAVRERSTFKTFKKCEKWLNQNYKIMEE